VKLLKQESEEIEERLAEIVPIVRKDLVGVEEPEEDGEKFIIVAPVGKAISLKYHPEYLEVVAEVLVLVSIGLCSTDAVYLEEREAICKAEVELSFVFAFQLHLINLRHVR
jgi:hypothetical protein